VFYITLLASCTSLVHIHYLHSKFGMLTGKMF